MNAIFTLLTVSTIAGLVLALYFSWVAILASSLVLAIISAVILQHLAFGSLAGITIIVACLSVNQIAYLLGVLARVPSILLPHDPSVVFGNAIALPPQRSKRK